MSSSFFSHLEEDHQSITLENALSHLDLINVIKFHCKPNADLKDLILDFEERPGTDQIKEWELNVIEFFIELRCALEKGTLDCIDSKLKKPILKTLLDPATWCNWVTNKRMFLSNGLVFKSKELQSLYDDMENSLAKLKILYPDRYKKDNSLDDENIVSDEQNPMSKRGVHPHPKREIVRKMAIDLKQQHELRFATDVLFRTEMKLALVEDGNKPILWGKSLSDKEFESLTKIPKSTVLGWIRAAVYSESKMSN